MPPAATTAVRQTGGRVRRGAPLVAVADARRRRWQRAQAARCAASSAGARPGGAPAIRAKAAGVRHPCPSNIPGVSLPAPVPGPVAMAPLSSGGGRRQAGGRTAPARATVYFGSNGGGEVEFEPTAVRVWKRLEREERQKAASHFFAQPSEEVLGSALAAIVKARHLRPQVARSMAPEEQARALASVLDPGEPLASSLLVSLHLGDRRPMLAAFLDAVGLPHDDGILKEEADASPLDERRLRAGVETLSARFGSHEVQTYLNTLWLQDPDRWDGLRGLSETTSPT